MIKGSNDLVALMSSLVGLYTSTWLNGQLSRLSNIEGEKLKYWSSNFSFFFRLKKSNNVRNFLKNYIYFAKLVTKKTVGLREFKKNSNYILLPVALLHQFRLIADFHKLPSMISSLSTLCPGLLSQLRDEQGKG